MDKWKEHIEMGHRLFAHKDFQEAKAQYQFACERALHLSSEIGDEKSTISTIMAAVVSHHGLADLYIQEGKASLAQFEFERLHHHLHVNLNKPHVSEERKTILLYGLQRTHALQLEYMMGTGGCFSKQPQTKFM